MQLCNIFQKSEQLALPGAVVKRLKRPKSGERVSGRLRRQVGADCPVVQTAVKKEPVWSRKSCAFLRVGRREAEGRSQRASSAVMSSRSDPAGSREPARLESSPGGLHCRKLRVDRRPKGKIRQSLKKQDGINRGQNHFRGADHLDRSPAWGAHLCFKPFSLHPSVTPEQ